MNLAHRLWWAIAAPIRFSLETGHWRSALSGKSVDARGKPIPWYTYPAIHFLAQLDVRGKSVLEFGGGQSTLWWAERGARVLTIEQDRTWFHYLKRKLHGNERVEILLREKFSEYVSLPRDRRNFDIVAIDGGPREECAKISVQVASPTAIIIFDDSEGYRRDKTDGSHPAVEAIQSAGFLRVDFYGYAPVNWKPHCTSIFFRSESTLLHGLKPPVRNAIWNSP